MTFQSVKAGDGIGIIAPAGNIEHNQIKQAITILENKKFNVKFSQNLFQKNRYFAGQTDQRATDIHQCLKDDQLHALFAARGGVGTHQILPHLDFSLWKKSRKPLIGFSDVTALQWALWHRSGITSFSGMTLTTQLNDSNPYLDLFFDLLSETRRKIIDTNVQRENIQIVRHGSARGLLIGGSLSIICSLLGTPYFPHLPPLIFFVEDINEPFYRIERMLFQLKLSGVLDKIRGLILGRFKFKDQILEILPTLEYLFPSDIPIVQNFPYGHYEKSCPLPIGIQAVFSTKPFTLSWEKS